MTSGDSLKLPNGFHWCVGKVVRDDIEDLYTFLANNYVEDDDMMFRFHYSKAFLQWALQPPGWKADWHVVIRNTATGELIGFVAAVPGRICMSGLSERIVHINFLCVHKKFRNLRLTPVLIGEITQRTQLCGIQRAMYTAGRDEKDSVITSSQYWHRFLDPRKLNDIGFMHASPSMTSDTAEEIFCVPKERSLARLRPLEKRDVSKVTVLLNDDFVSRRVVHPVLSEEEIEHYLLPRHDIIESYVIESLDGGITDLISFYRLDSSVLADTSCLKAAFMYHTATTETPLRELLLDILVIAKNKKYDVFNALDVSADSLQLVDLKFRPGDGQLQYYMHNQATSLNLDPSQVGVILV